MIYWKVPLYLNQLGSLLQDYKTILFGSCKIHSSFEFWKGNFPQNFLKEKETCTVYKNTEGSSPWRVKTDTQGDKLQCKFVL